MKNGILLSAAALCVIGGALAFPFKSNEKKLKNSQAELPVEIIEVKPRDVSLAYNTIGMAKALQSATVRAQTDGIITEILFTEGDYVEQGAVLAKIDDRETLAALEKSKAVLDMDKAKLAETEINLQRSKQLIKNKIISQRAWDEQNSQYKQLKATVRKDEADVRLAEINYSYTQITSPVSGRIGIKRIGLGNMIKKADTDGLVSVMQIDPIAVEFSLPQTMLDKMQKIKGAEVEIFERQSNKFLGKGIVYAFDNNVAFNSGTLKLKAKIKNSEDLLWPGQFVSVILNYGQLANALTVPSNAVRPSEKGDFVYLYENGIAKAVQVETGYSNDEYTVISSGLQSGEKVITDGFAQLSDGSRVEIVSEL